MKKELKKYLAEIGAKGGKASRRTITPEQQAAMQAARKAARLRCLQRRRPLQDMVHALRWEKRKPTKPGEYFTRHASDGSCVNTVVVTKTGRGLRVYCAAYNDRVPMSDIGDTELEWAERFQFLTYEE